MKILLVRPISDTFIITPPIGLGYIATALRGVGLKPQVLDCAKEKFGFIKFENFIKNLKPDVVGFQVWSCDVPQVEKSLSIVKKINNKTITLIGGAHPSGAPLEAMEYFRDADFGFSGEAEVGISLLARRFLGESIGFDKIPGLIWRENGIIRVNPPIFADDLDSFGFPAWDLMPPKSYPRAPHQGFAKAFPTAPIVITRGCPFSCSFCATHSINGKKNRSRSINHVIKEIKLLKNEYGVKEIHVDDDNFTLNRNFLRSFCQELTDSKLGIFWHCSSGVRIGSLDNGTLLLMKKSGCYTLTVAIESGVQRVLNLMKKGLTVDGIRKNVKLINQSGYRPTGLFMIGFPGETKDDIKQTINFARSLDLKRAQFAIFHPMPGTEIFNELRGMGKLKNIDWTKVKPSEIACPPDGISEVELKKLQRYAFLKFHLRPRVLWYQMKEVNSLSHLWFLLKRLYSMLF